MILPPRLRAARAERRLLAARAENLALQVEIHRLHGLIVYQRGRLKDLSAEALGAQVRATTPRRHATSDTVVMGRQS